MASKNQNEQLTHAAIGQAAVIALVGLFIWFYTFPKYTELSASVQDTNALIRSYNTTESSGIPYNQLRDVINTSWGGKELLWIVQNYQKETEEAIKKVGNLSYLKWLDEMIGDTTDSQALAIDQAKLSSIIPTLSPINNGVDTDAISLKKFISFIEDNIIRQFGLESNTAIGIQNIKYGDGTVIPKTIGSFDSEISFTALNNDIWKMLAYVNTLGHTDILTNTGTATMSGAVPWLMSNPLVIVQGISLQKPLDMNKPNEKNTGQVTLRFYIRGSSEADIVFLTETIQHKQEKIKKSVDELVKRCMGSDACVKKNEVQNLAKKYTEFARSLNLSKKSWVEGIYVLWAALDTLNSIEKELATYNI